MKDEKVRTARSGFRLSCVTLLCVGVAVATRAVGEVPQTEVYDGLANTAYSSSYMNRGSYSGSANSVGYCDATVVVGAGAEDEIAFASPTFTLFSRYAKSSAAQPLDTRPFAGFILSIR